MLVRLVDCHTCQSIQGKETKPMNTGFFTRMLQHKKLFIIMLYFKNHLHHMLHSYNLQNKKIILPKKQLVIGKKKRGSRDCN